VFEAFPENSVTADLKPAVDIRRSVQDSIRVQDLPDARVQKLVKTLAAAKHVPISGSAAALTGAAAMKAAFGAEDLVLQKRKLGSKVAAAAVYKLRPQLLQWVMQQRGLWEES
jgi:hypothetical protein